MSFFTSFTETILHSTWQSALLLLFYAVISFSSVKNHPLRKRNMLFGLLAVQFAASVFTFFFFYLAAGTSHTVIGSLISSNSFFSLLNEYSNQIFFIYAAVVCIKALSVSFQWKKFQREYTSHISKASSDLKIFTQLKAYHLGIKRKVSLWYSDRITTPITFGFLKPVILLPVSLVNRISTEQAEAIILHELAHIKSRDYLLNWFLIAMEIIYFFNPFIKIISKKIRLQREMNCDLQVINFEYDNIIYAEALLQTAKLGHSSKPFQLNAAASHLVKRISFFSGRKNIDIANNAKTRFPFAFIPAALLMIFLTTGIFKHNENKVGAFAVNNMVTMPIAYSENKSFSSSAPAVAVAEPMTDYSADEIPQPDPQADPDEEAIMHSYTDENLNTLHNIVPVVLKGIPDSVREFTYEVETQAGKITQSFKLTQVNGQWTMQPQWMMMQTKGDSSRRMIADTLKYFREMMPQ